MTLSNWLFGTCGRSHIGIYVCSRCGYELLRSGFEKNFVLKYLNLQGLLPLPATVAAAKANSNGGGGNKNTKKSYISTPFNDSMLEDFTTNANRGATFHQASLVKRLIQLEESNQGGIATTADARTNFGISCGKCGSSLGHQSIRAGQATFFIRKNSVDLTFRTT